MIEIFILSFCATFLQTPFGYLIQKGSNLRSFSMQHIYGLIILSFFALLLNFFTPLNEFVNSIFLILGLILIIKYYRVFLTKKYFLYSIISSLIIFLLITSSDVYRPDAGLYHLPYIKILNEEKIIFGISNLHFRFGHISIIQYLSALNFNFIFKENGIVLPSAMLSAASIIYFLSNLNFRLKKKKFDFYFFFALSLLLFIFYKVNRYSEYGNDAPAHLLTFILISEIIKNFYNFRFNDIHKYFLISSYIIMNKIILIPVTLFTFVFFLRKNLLNNLKLFIINKKTLFLILFFFMWFTKNIFTSGCILYPIKITCFNNLEWTDSLTIEKVSIENEAWAKGWPDYRDKINAVSQFEYSKKFNWIETWSKNHFIKIIEILAPYIIFFIILFFVLKSGNKKQKNELHLKYLFFVSLFGFILWFLKVPVFRYGYSLIIVPLSLVFSYFFARINLKKNTNTILNTILIIFIIGFVSKNLNRIIFSDNKYYNHPWPKYYSFKKDNQIEEPKSKLISGKKIYFVENDYCMYSYGPCGLYNENLEIKIKNNYTFYNLSVN